MEAARSLDRRLQGLEHQLGGLLGQNLAQHVEANRWRSEQVGAQLLGCGVVGVQQHAGLLPRGRAA